MNIIKLLMLACIMIISYIVYSYTTNDISHEKLIPYSNSQDIKEDYASIIRYGIERLESKYKIPEVKINIKTCSKNVAGKYTLNSITICKEFLNNIEAAYKGLELNDYAKSVNATILFVLYHEFAHLFVDVYDLPIVGNEEIAADQFAALMLLDDYLLYHYLEAYKQIIKDVDEIPAWDEHPSYKQQYYNLACLLYGYDQEQYKTLAKELHDRAKRCKYEYNSIQESWSVLLGQNK